MRGQLESDPVSDPVLAGSERLTAWVEDLCAVSPVVILFDDLH
jgi:hypothetical protein